MLTFLACLQELTKKKKKKTAIGISNSLPVDEVIATNCHCIEQNVDHPVKVVDNLF